MPKKHFAEDLSEDKIRFLLKQKLLSANRGNARRLERYRRTGRTITLVRDTSSPSLEHFFTTSLNDPEGQTHEEIFHREHQWPSPLLIAECLLFAGLFITILYGLGQIKSLNLQSAQALVLPTLTATPIINAVVIPSGHTPPTSPGGTRPNDAEIPEHLRPLVQVQINLPTPTPAIEQAIRIHIPRLAVDAPVVQGDGWEQLKKGVAQHLGTANPGEKGNMVLTGHNDVFGEVFRYLDQLQAGDELHIYTARRSYTYIVSGWKLVKPTQVEVMNPTPDATITLISCYPYLIDNQRIIVTGWLSS